MDQLLAVYTGCTIVGGGLVLLSFFADHDTDADVDVDMDVDCDVDVDCDADHDVELSGSVSVGDALWMPVLSLRFWIFFTAFFGLTGVGLHFSGGLGRYPTLYTALGIGLFSGYTVSRLVQKLRSEQVHGNVDPATDYIGAMGEVLLVIDSASPGQVRLNVKGIDVDLPAITEGSAQLERGMQVKVQRYAEGTLLVVPVQEAA
jgi:hypothetical protein